jgi:glycosyltransferase involved in cell wall biosynthesis
MKALHLFPTFGTEETDGADAYQRRLTLALVRGGAEVEVLATCSRRPLFRGAFALDWPYDHPNGAADVDGIGVRRFPVRLSPGRFLGPLLSLPIAARWRREEARQGRLGEASDEAAAAHARQARARPPLYDFLALAGRGPHSVALVRAGLAAARRADVILAGFTPFATLWYAIHIAARAGKPLVLLPLFHPDDARHHFRHLYRCFARADALLAQTAYSAALFAALAPGCRPVEIGAGVEPREFADERVSGARFRQRFGIGAEVGIVLCVGRKERHKRYDLAVEAVERIGSERVLLVLIGADVDRRPLAAAHTRYLGPLPRGEVLDAYDACDVFVLPSEHESFGIVLLEAWMRAKPVIGNARCRPVASLLDGGGEGLLARDAGELAAQIQALLADRERARRLGEAGRARTVRRYTWDHIGATVRSLYEELAARGGAARGPATDSQATWHGSRSRIHRR